MTSLGLVSEDAHVPVTEKESVMVELSAAMLPMVEPQEMESLGEHISGRETSEVEGSQEDIRPFWPAKERKANEANVRRSRTSPSLRLQRSTSLGFLKQDRERNGSSPRRKCVGLRLPSFTGLGISALDPKYLTRGGHAEGKYSRSEVLSQTQRPELRPRPLSIYHHASEPHFGSTPLLTPPEDNDSIKWNKALLQASSSSTSHCREQADNTSGRSSSLPGQQELPDQRSNMSAPSGQPRDDTSGEGQAWLDQAIECTVSSTGKSPAQNSTVNVVAHVLPLPAEDSSPHHAVFEATIQAIQARHGPVNQPYITITHAVPHKFDLNSLPTSPPATPNLVQQGGDYFNQYTFAHAAVVPAYHAPTRGFGASTTSSQHPIVPPRSAQVAILERYIPPSSVQEYDDLFSSHGRSALMNRLSELSVDDGSLLFIYPTRAGARTFSDSYLSPILTPNLLQIVNLNRLVWNLAEEIGRMAAIQTMDEFDVMKTKVTNLCKSLSEHPSTNGGSRFSLVYSSSGSVPLDQATWREWYIEQEQSRIRQVLNNYWKQGRRLPGDIEVTDATIARAIIDGLRKGVTHARPTLGEGVEVGVFVIKRSSVST